jgi:hypothetical protein
MKMSPAFFRPAYRARKYFFSEFYSYFQAYRDQKAVIKKAVLLSVIVQFAGMYLDRAYKQNMLHYFRATLRRVGSSHREKSSSNRVFSKYGLVFFFEGGFQTKMSA